jgi:hypothetical protein
VLSGVVADEAVAAGMTNDENDEYINIKVNMAKNVFFSVFVFVIFVTPYIVNSTIKLSSHYP